LTITQLFQSSELEERRQLLKFALQNCVLDGKKVRYTLQKPFDAILIYASRQAWLPEPKGIISKALGTILSAFEDVNQMEVVRVRWEQIKRLQLNYA